jgi:hypothetical protein
MHACAPSCKATLRCWRRCSAASIRRWSSSATCAPCRTPGSTKCTAPGRDVPPRAGAVQDGETTGWSPGFGQEQASEVEAEVGTSGTIEPMNNDIEEEHPWDAALAQTLPGQLVLVGLACFETDSENPVEQQQLFGRVVAADERKGIRLSLEGRRTGEEFSLPPDTRSFQRAGSGEYRLRSTGETVVNPDFTVTFSIRRQGRAQGSD